MLWKRAKQQHTVDDVAATVKDLSVSLEARLAQLDAGYQALRERIEDKLEKVEVASQAVQVAITQQSGWTRLPVSSNFQDPTTDEMHNALPLLMTPAFDLLLTLHNPLYGSHTATNLIIPRRYVRLQDVTLSNGHNGLALITDWEFAPRGWHAAMQSLTAEQDSEIWLSDFKQASDHENQIEIHQYPFVRDEELARSAPWSEKHGVMFFDLALGYSRHFTNPLLAASVTDVRVDGNTQSH